MKTTRLATIESFVLIGRPAAAVFEFVTNASLWSHWHPATVSVLAAPRPLTVGEQMTETIRAGRRRFTATWTVLACEAAVAVGHRGVAAGGRRAHRL